MCDTWFTNSGMARGGMAGCMQGCTVVQRVPVTKKGTGKKGCTEIDTPKKRPMYMLFSRWLEYPSVHLAYYRSKSDPD